MHRPLAVIVTLLLGCGGSPDVPHGSATLTGAASFPVNSGYELAPDLNGSPDLRIVELVLLDQNWSCGDLNANAGGSPPHQFLEVVMSGPAPFAAGSYPVQPADTAYNDTQLVKLRTYLDGNPAFSADGGTLTLDVLTTAEMKGSFTVTDGAGASLSGTFDTHFCPVPQAFQ